jgi:NAD(P)-dependent dehydrogenase (short-subunit alcohol dehydrogenase family)
VVTGASSGLGRAVAAVLGERGARVVGLARRGDELAETVRIVADRGGELVAVQGDVALVDDCRRAVDVAVARFGGLDIVVNNAGAGGPVALVEDLDEVEWDHVVDVNLKGPAFLCRWALPHLLRRGGVILNVASINAIHPLRGMAAYNASKAGLLQLTNTVAIEYGARGVRCNAIVLGGVESEMNTRLRREVGRRLRGPEWEPSGERRARMTPEEAARAIALLCSADASVVNGATIALDGGISAGLLHASYVELASAELLPSR